MYLEVLEVLAMYLEVLEVPGGVPGGAGMVYLEVYLEVPAWCTWRYREAWCTWRYPGGLVYLEAWCTWRPGHEAWCTWRPGHEAWYMRPGTWR